MVKNIVDNLRSIRIAFISAMLDPPAAIHLKTHDDGMKLLASIHGMPDMVYPGDRRLGVPVEMADGSVYMEVEIEGMKIRWPADKTYTSVGKWMFT